MFSAIPVDTKAKLKYNQIKKTFQEIEIQKAELLVKGFLKNVSDFKLKLFPPIAIAQGVNIFSRD